QYWGWLTQSHREYLARRRTEHSRSGSVAETGVSTCNEGQKPVSQVADPGWQHSGRVVGNCSLRTEARGHSRFARRASLSPGDGRNEVTDAGGRLANRSRAVRDRWPKGGPPPVRIGTKPDVF